MSLAPDAASPPASAGLGITVVVLTYNEEANLADCLQSCAWCDDVHVVDSGSTDATVEVARQLGASVHTNPFQSFGQQRNWAIDHVPHKHDWVFHLDADERMTPELVEEMRAVVEAASTKAGYYVPHKLIFMGRWVRRAEGGYPVYQMRFFHRGRMRFRDHGHGQREDTRGEIGLLRQPYLHYNFSKGIDDWVDKHNRYSTLEARQIVSGHSEPDGGGSPFGNTVERRRFFKSRLYPKLPGRWLWRFLWMYVLRFGFLDGRAGLHYCLLVSTYDLFTTLKVEEVRRNLAGHVETAPVVIPGAGRDTGATVVAGLKADGAGTSAVPDVGPPRPAEKVQLMPERSPWTTREKVGRVLWMFAQATLFRLSFHNWYGWRRVVLRSFGAKIGSGVRIRPTAVVEVPWNVEIGDETAVGDHAIIYSLGRIRIGRLVTISQYAHLCAGTHDPTDLRFPLLRPPIAVEDEAWVAADAFVGPNVTVGRRAVVGARATVTRDVPADEIWAGNPARYIKTRVLKTAGGPAIVEAPNSSPIPL